MIYRRWTLTVHDARGRRRRGSVSLSGTPDRVAEPVLPLRFAITLLTHPCDVSAAPAGSAVCIPAEPWLRAVDAAPAPPPLPSRIEELRLPLHTMQEYASGRIVMQHAGVIDPADVFPPHSDHPRLDRLALALLEAAEAEAIAPYTALIRHELALPRGTDALIALEARVTPVDPARRPPQRAPAIVRLRRLLRSLRDGAPGDAPLEAVMQDLRFLRLFDADAEPMPHAALERLLADVRAARPHRKRRTPDRGSRIVPMRPRDDA